MLSVVLTHRERISHVVASGRLYQRIGYGSSNDRGRGRQIGRRTPPAPTVRQTRSMGHPVRYAYITSQRPWTTHGDEI